jgi:hypothetical protein
VFRQNTLGKKAKAAQEAHSLFSIRTYSQTPLVLFPRVPEDGDPYTQPEDGNYENESVRQLENELQLEEYLKQKLQDEAYQVQEAAAAPPLSTALLHGVLPIKWAPSSLFLPYLSGILWNSRSTHPRQQCFKCLL